jgi:hypothetical protein
LEDEKELDPVETAKLLVAIQQQHYNNCLRTTQTIAATRTVYSRRLRKNIYATSWNLLELDTKEGALPPPPIPTPPPSTPDTETNELGRHSGMDQEDQDTDEEDRYYYDTDEEELAVQRRKNRARRREGKSSLVDRKSKHQYQFSFGIVRLGLVETKTSKSLAFVATTSVGKSTTRERKIENETKKIQSIVARRRTWVNGKRVACDPQCHSFIFQPRHSSHKIVVRQKNQFPA